MEIGDIITAINKQPVEEIVKSKLRLTPASNYTTQLRDIAPQLLRTNDSIIEIEFNRNDKKENLTLKTFSSSEIRIKDKFEVTDTCFRYIKKDIAYINNGSLKRKYLAKIWKEIENTKGLVIDLRNYPSDFPGRDLCDYLMPESTPVAKFTSSSIETPGLFTFKKEMNVGKKNKGYYKGKVIILINEISQSSAEYNAMMYRTHPNAIVLGSTTAGSDGNVSTYIYLPGGIVTRFTGLGWYYPDGKETQRIGIIPNIEFKKTIQGITKEEDELLTKAIEVIMSMQK